MPLQIFVGVLLYPNLYPYHIKSPDFFTSRTGAIALLSVFLEMILQRCEK